MYAGSGWRQDVFALNYQPIGLLRTPFKSISEMPIQPAGAHGVIGHIELLPDLVEGLQDLDGFSHFIVLYHFHQVTDVRLTVIPFLDTIPRGLFSTRAPSRPNPIGLSVLRLLTIAGTTLEVEGVDMLDKTPLLDIKPYVPDFDQPHGPIQTGWMKDVSSRAPLTRSDNRFK